MTVDWNQVLADQANDPQGQPIPEGPYDVRVVKADYAKASTGSDMIKLTVEVENGPYAGRWVWTNLVFKFDSTAAARMLLRRLSAFGITGEYLAANNPQVQQIASALMGRSAIAEVNQREWQGDIRNDVNMFRAKDGAGAVAPPVVVSEAAPSAPSVGPATPVGAGVPAASGPPTGPAEPASTTPGRPF